MKAHHFLFALCSLVALPAGVQADEAAAVEFREAWIRAAPPASPVMAAYVRIANTSRREFVVTGVLSPAFDAVEMHEMRSVDGVMRMRPLHQLRLDPETTVELAPGGTHLMLFRPVRELRAGERVSIEFELGEGDARAVEFEVRPATYGVE